MPASRRRLTVADLPTVRLYPSGSPGSLAWRDRSRYERAKNRILTAFAAFGREMTRGEISGYVLTGYPLRELAEILDDLVDEGRLMLRVETCVTSPDRLSRVYSLATNQEGGLG